MRYSRTTLLLFITIATISASCGPAHYLKKADRALKKAEQLGAKITPDTVYIDRTYIVPERTVDTLLLRVNFTDTIRMETEKVKWKTKVNTVTRTIYTQVTCKPDTIKIKVPVTVEKEIKAGYGQWHLSLVALWCLILGAIIGRVFWRR